MFYIILFCIVIFKLPVSTNQFQYRSVADMTNIHRTKVMLPIHLAQPETVQLFLNHKATTCIDIAARYEGGIYRDEETVCNTIQRQPETRLQVTPTAEMLRYSRVPTQTPSRQLGSEPLGTIKHQMMLHKQANNNPENFARTPRQKMMPKLLLRASLRPGQQAPHAAKRQKNDENRYFQEYQLVPQVLPSDFRIRDHHEHQPNPQGIYLNNEYQQEFYPKAHGSSTSTAAPIPVSDSIGPYTSSSRTTSMMTTTSTMPPFPGGYIPGEDDLSSSEHKVCGGKAKCHQYLWTTKKKKYNKRTTEFLLWTP